MAEFDIISYISSLTGFSFERGVLERIAMERGVINATSIEEIDARTKGLIKADLLFVVYTSPTTTGSYSRQHGAYSESIGGQSITDKANIYDMMMALYKKWDDKEMIETLDDMEGGLQWLNY